MNEIEMHAYVTGLVQGVGFRVTVFNHAMSLNIKGFVRNLPDGRVEIYAQNTKKNLEELLHLLKTKGRGSKISNIDLQFSTITSPFTSFEII